MSELNTMIAIQRNDERYPPDQRRKKEYPEFVVVIGTYKQAQSICDRFSQSESDCDDYYTIVDEHAIPAIVFGGQDGKVRVVT